MLHAHGFADKLPELLSAALARLARSARGSSRARAKAPTPTPTAPAARAPRTRRCASAPRARRACAGCATPSSSRASAEALRQRLLLRGGAPGASSPEDLLSALGEAPGGGGDDDDDGDAWGLRAGTPTAFAERALPRLLRARARASARARRGAARRRGRGRLAAACGAALAELAPDGGGGGGGGGPPARESHRVLVVPPGVAVHCVVASRDPAQRNSAIEVYWQIGRDATAAAAADRDATRPRGAGAHERLLADLLEQILEEPLFDALRTKEQLGYSVSCGARWTDGVVGFGVRVVSESASPAKLLARLDAFLETFRGELARMDGAEFREHAAALAARKLEPATTPRTRRPTSGSTSRTAGASRRASRSRAPTRRCSLA